MVAAFAYDWQPGATDSAVAGYRTVVSADNFSSTEVLHASDAQWDISEEEKVFEPGTYSVVFFVALPDNPPQFFAEVRSEVNGDITVTAPAWENWVRTRSKH